MEQTKQKKEPSIDKVAAIAFKASLESRGVVLEPNVPFVCRLSDGYFILTLTDEQDVNCRLTNEVDGELPVPMAMFISKGVEH